MRSFTNTIMAYLKAQRLQHHRRLREGFIHPRVRGNSCVAAVFADIHIAENVLISLSRSSARNHRAGGNVSQTAIQEIRPWDRPFWKPAPRKGAVLFYLVLIHLLAIIGLLLFPLPTPKVLGLAFLLAALGGFGITVCYHRLLAHRSLQLNKFVEHFLIFWAMLNSGGSPASWVAYHRHHHSHTDTPEDISSLKQGGFWWAHLRWLYQSDRADEQKSCPELSRVIYKFWTHAHAPVRRARLSFGLLLDWQGCFWLCRFG